MRVMKGKSFRMEKWGVSPDVQGREPPFHQGLCISIIDSNDFVIAAVLTAC